MKECNDSSEENDAKFTNGEIIETVDENLAFPSLAFCFGNAQEGRHGVLLETRKERAVVRGRGGGG